MSTSSSMMATLDFPFMSLSLGGLGLPAIARQQELEHRTAIVGVAGDEAAAELGREAGGDGEAEPEALAGLLGGVERLEQLVGVHEAAAVVLDRQLDLLALDQQDLDLAVVRATLDANAMAVFSTGETLYKAGTWIDVIPW
jgi:hypothetical protein